MIDAPAPTAEELEFPPVPNTPSTDVNIQPLGSGD